ncbi:uncharacterized protein BXZ73DRAFT_51070, partial [Epithele typhae]|uniref:uncharacterized protein n=1 Tax=Epithele typhae TaxID=378194 RepID=UPI002007F73F
CPECPFVSKHRATITRHIPLHKCSSNWVCAGVPLEHARKYGLDPATRTVHEFGGREMVGGCFALLSNRISLRSHLRICGDKCVGDTFGSWHDGNKHRYE